jgi:sortase A
LPGELGNVGIAGHRDTHFRPLRNIRLNDEVIVTTKTSTIRYVIDSLRIIHPTDMDILDPTPGPALTLVTCYPFEFIGNAPMRFIVRARPRGNVGGSSTYAQR